MPNTTRNAADAAAAKDSPPFEEALQRLESIVESMESGDLPLEKLLAQFEDGTRLARICQTKLNEAEQKISVLEKNAAGDPVLTPLNAAPTDDE